MPHKDINRNGMNSKRLVRLSNAIGVISIILLIYWIFIFISIQVFDLKVFREYIKEAFLLSILGILSVMFGALMINIMFNLTRIADKHNADNTHDNKNIKKTLILTLLSFPFIFMLLLGADWYTARIKEQSLIKAAETIIINNESTANEITDYSYSKQWLLNTRGKLNYFSRIDRYFPSVSVLVLDTIDHHKVYLEYKSHFHLNETDSILPDKFDFIKATTREERNYLAEVFEQNSNKLRFNRHRGNYELFYPYAFKDKTVVFYFSDYQYYGKFAYGSYPERDEGIVMEPITVEVTENE